MAEDSKVPEAPVEQVTIPSEDMCRLARWVEFFQKLSARRVSVMQPKDAEFEGLLEKAERLLRKSRPIEPDKQLVGWPTEDEIAFVVMIDSSMAGSIVETIELHNVYFFCFNNLAFSPTHFQWDGDGDAGDWAMTYSLSGYSRSALTWDFIRSLIERRATELEQQVPAFEESK